MYGKCNSPRDQFRGVFFVFRLETLVAAQNICFTCSNLNDSKMNEIQVL